MDLDSKQSAMLARASALLPSAQQESFRASVRGVIGTLLHYPPTDAELRDCLRHFLAARGISVGELLPSHERKYVHDRSANNWRDWRKQNGVSGTPISQPTLADEPRRHDKENSDATQSLFQSRR